MHNIKVVVNVVVAGFTTLFLFIFYPQLVDHFIAPMYNLYQSLFPSPRPEMTFWWKLLPIFILGVIIWRGIMMALGKVGWDSDARDIESGGKGSEED